MRFKRKKDKRSAYQVWGIRAPANVRLRWLTMSRILGVPCNRLILFILKDWAKSNRQFLLNEDGRKELAHRITQDYLTGNLE